jgi:hypothetical protein
MGICISAKQQAGEVSGGSHGLAWIIRPIIACITAAVAIASFALLVPKLEAVPVARHLQSAGAGSALALQGTRATNRDGFLTVVGEVENASSSSFDNVEAVVELLDSEDHLVQVESALLELPNLNAGVRSPFSVHSRVNNGVTGYRIRFRTLLGHALSLRIVTP